MCLQILSKSRCTCGFTKNAYDNNCACIWENKGIPIIYHVQYFFEDEKYAFELKSINTL